MKVIEYYTVYVVWAPLLFRKDIQSKACVTFSFSDKSYRMVEILCISYKLLMFRSGFYINF